MEAEDTVISNDDIDGTRFRVLDELEKKAKVNWWDICKAVEGISGKQASMDAEQFLIDITNTTGVEVAKAQAEISFEAGYEQGWNDNKPYLPDANEPWDREQTVFNDGKQAGIHEVAEWVEANLQYPTRGEGLVLKRNMDWQEKLKEWGIV